MKDNCRIYLDAILEVMTGFYELKPGHVLYRLKWSGGRRFTPERDFFYYLATTLLPDRCRLWEIGFWVKNFERKNLATSTIQSRAKKHLGRIKYDPYFRDECQEVESLCREILTGKKAPHPEQLINLRELVLQGIVPMAKAASAYDMPINTLRKFIYGNQLSEVGRYARRLYVMMYEKYSAPGYVKATKEELRELCKFPQVDFDIAYKELIDSEYVTKDGSRYYLNFEYQ